MGPLHLPGGSPGDGEAKAYRSGGPTGGVEKDGHPSTVASLGGRALPLSRQAVRRTDSGKWRLIVDLSSPKGTSVNDRIDPSLWSVSYASVEDMTLAVLHLEWGCKVRPGERLLSDPGTPRQPAPTMHSVERINLHRRGRYLLGCGRRQSCLGQ